MEFKKNCIPMAMPPVVLMVGKLMQELCQLPLELFFQAANVV